MEMIDIGRYSVSISMRWHRRSPSLTNGPNTTVDDVPASCAEVALNEDPLRRGMAAAWNSPQPVACDSPQSAVTGNYPDRCSCPPSPQGERGVAGSSPAARYDDAQHQDPGCAAWRTVAVEVRFRGSRPRAGILRRCRGRGWATDTGAF